MESHFDKKINSYYFRLNSTYPDLISYCNEVFYADITKLKKYLSVQCNDSPNRAIDITIDSDFSSEEPSVLTKYVLSKLDEHLSGLSVSDVKKKLHDFILLKKRDYKKRVLAGDFVKVSFYNEQSEEVCLSWLADGNNLILPDFAFYKELSLNMQLPHTLATLEYLLCDCINENSSYIYPDDENFYLYSLNSRESAPPKCEVTNKGTLNFFYDFKLDDENVRRVYLAQNIVPKEKVSTDSLDKNELALYSENYKDYLIPILPDDEAQQINLIFYNMLNYDWCEKGYMDYYIDDILVRMKPELSKKGLTQEERHLKNRLRQKIIDTLNDMPTFRVTDYSIDANTGKTNLKQSLEGGLIFNESKYLDEKTGKIRTSISFNAIDSWKKSKNNIVLKDDYDRISNSNAQQILFFLQGIRVNSRNNGYEATVPISVFKSYFLSQSSEKKYLSKMYAAFDELKFKSILISDYSRVERSFNFTFIPLDDFELEQYNLK